MENHRIFYATVCARRFALFRNCSSSIRLCFSRRSEVRLRTGIPVLCSVAVALRKAAGYGASSMPRPCEARANVVPFTIDSGEPPACIHGDHRRVTHRRGSCRRASRWATWRASMDPLPRSGGQVRVDIHTEGPVEGEAVVLTGESPY